MGEALPLFEIAALSAGACLAGAMNAIAGGGTIVTFPLLIALGMPAIQANATSTVALMVGIFGSVYGYRQNLPAAKPWMKLFAPMSILGGLLGAWLLTVTSEKFFNDIVPFLILFATVLFLLGNVAGRIAGFDGNVNAVSPAKKFVAVLIQFGVAIYGGYFGAGIGILMLAAFAFIGLKNIHEMNALKTILGGLINLVAAVYFVQAGLVIWPVAFLMMLASAVGYYGGAALTQKIPQRLVRILIAGIGLTLSAVFFWRQFA
ncbi:MAG: sulfite exporter TauE/SafE family protein [Terrimicrobiaceae bacterium]